MVWINNECINKSAKPGYIGGAICTCPECTRIRREAAKTAAANWISQIRSIDRVSGSTKYRKNFVKAKLPETIK